MRSRRRSSSRSAPSRAHGRRSRASRAASSILRACRASRTAGTPSSRARRSRRTGAGAKAVQLGFSDRAHVYLNGAALYGGDATYRSRDYRFLGSIGWHDTVYLPLEQGDNELVVAVSEDFGGWGVQARVVD